MNSKFHYNIQNNRPVARKRQGISLFLIACDVISGCSGGHIKCIAVNGEITTACF